MEVGTLDDYCLIWGHISTGSRAELGAWVCREKVKRIQHSYGIRLMLVVLGQYCSGHGSAIYLLAREVLSCESNVREVAFQ